MESQSHDILADISSIRSIGYGVLDGGFATHLEDSLQQNISSSPLWSASLLQTEQGCSSIVQTHLDFLEAGSQIISTSTYQASLLSFAKAGLDENTSKQLLIRSVELAEEAREKFSKQNPGKEKHLISLSLGPFGASQSDGSEYTGLYFKPFTGEEVSTEDMTKFHFDRLNVIATSKGDVWKSIDLLAFETIPRIDEAIAIKEALKKLYSTVQCPRKPAYVSFVFPNGRSLPFPAARKEIQESKEEEEVQAHIDEIVKVTLDDDEVFIEGIGINCTKPYYLSNLVPLFTKAVKQLDGRRRQKPFLFIYPDGGLVWDGEAREWKSDKGMEDENQNQKKNVWAEKVMESAKEIQNASSPWSGCFIGGCCKSTTNDIRSIRMQIEKRIEEHLKE